MKVITREAIKIITIFYLSQLLLCPNIKMVSLLKPLTVFDFSEN